MSSPATIVIAQHGLSELTLECVRSFRRHHGDSTPIIIVDDGSPLASIRSIVSARLINVDLICRPRESVTSAWNSGAEAVKTPVIVFLNNDTTTLASWLDDLVAPLLDERVVVTGAEWRDEQAVPEGVLRRLPTRRFAAGWCFAVLRDDLEGVCGFDPSLETYFSDTDLQARILEGRGLGESGIAIPVVGRLRHIGHATAKRDPTRAARWRADRARFIATWQTHAK
jgi:GT2 family glycosyltransferase